MVVDKQGIMSSSIKEEHKPNDSLGATEQASLAPGRSSLALWVHNQQMARTEPISQVKQKWNENQKSRKFPYFTL